MERAERLGATKQAGNMRVNIMAERIREMALAGEPHDKLPRVRDLCSLLGTSINTLDDALAKLEAQNVIYRRHGQGVYVSPFARRKRVAVVLESIYLETPGLSPFWGMLWGLCVNTAQERAAEASELHEFYTVQTVSGKSRVFESLVTKLAGGEIDGMICIGCNLSLAEQEAMGDLPYVAFAAPAKYVVSIDANDYIPMAVKHLAVSGCERIALFIQTPHWFWLAGLETPTDTMPLAHYKSALAQCGLPYDPTLVAGYSQRVSMTEVPIRYEWGAPVGSLQEQGYEMAQHMFATPAGERPDGLVCLDDMMTFGAAFALDELGIKIGRDVRVVSHSNAGSPVLYRREHLMSLIEIEPRRVAEALFSALHSLMHRGKLETRSTVSPTFCPR